MLQRYFSYKIIESSSFNYFHLLNKEKESSA
jgi:hypothetical protein